MRQIYIYIFASIITAHVASRKRFYPYLSICLSGCLSVCLSVYPSDNFWTAWPIDLIFSMQVGHYHMYVEFRREGHEVKWKVTTAESFIFFSGW